MGKTKKAIIASDVFSFQVYIVVTYCLLAAMLVIIGSVLYLLIAYGKWSGWIGALAVVILALNAASLCAHWTVHRRWASKRYLTKIVATFLGAAYKKIDQVKSEFMALASHQLRTPLSAIAWNSEILLHDDAGKLTDEQREYVEKIHYSNQRMVTMVDAMLLLSSLEAGNFRVKPERIDAKALSHKIVLEQKKKLQTDKKLHVQEHYDPGLTAVLLDPRLLRIILENLISNALKYTAFGGGITITITHVSEKLTSTSGGSLRITVKDTGSGIPRRQQSKIFEKLYRASNAKQKDTDGTGLGLYIVRACLDKVGGRVWFDSAVRKGSTFYVLLPIEKEEI